MSGANPVETKVEKTAVAAAALTDPIVAPAVVKSGWWFLRSRKRLGLLAGGSAIALVAGGYGYKYFTATPGTVSAQTETPVVAEAKPEEPGKLPALPSKPAEKPEFDLNLPDLPPPPAPGKRERDKEQLELRLPDVPSPPVDTPPPPLILPTVKSPDKKKVEPAEDIFKAQDPLISDKKKPDLGPAPLATDVSGKKEKDTPMPVIRISAQDPPAPPPVPKIDDIPPPPPVPAATKKDDPLKLDLDLPPLPGSPTKKEKDDPVVVPPIKSPMIPDVPTIPMKEKEIKAPEPGLPPVKIPDSPPITIDIPPMPMPRMIDTPPSPPTINLDPPPAVAAPKTDKKDMYEEDWHQQRRDDTYTLISKEYYKSGDYAAALEAYNKDRRKAADGIIRVPPIWVLQEQFPNLIEADKPERTNVPEVKTTGNVKFEPVTPTVSGVRPAPPPAVARSNDEYKVPEGAGETIREVARKVYGNADSWRKIFDLNPGVDPTQPIPSGTTLRLGR
jgi:hypothetical protein